MSPVRADTLRFEEVAVGDALPELVIPLTRTLIVATAIASREAKLNQCVRNSTAMHASFSNACASSISLHSVLIAVRCARFAYQVCPISTRRLAGSTLK